MVLHTLEAALRAFHGDATWRGASSGATSASVAPDGDQEHGGSSSNGQGTATTAAGLAGVAATSLAEAKLSVLLTWGPEGQVEDLWCHAQALPPRPKHPIKVIVCGHPRHNALAKDSDWVREREALERSMPQGVQETVLSDPASGAVLEGLSSNFYALSARGELVTAQEGVLMGTVRELVLQVCGELGVPVVLRAPLLSNVATWQAAFISSTSRLLLAVDEVDLPQGAQLAGHGSTGGATSKVFGQQPPLARALEEGVMRKVWACSEPLTSS